MTTSSSRRRPSRGGRGGQEPRARIQQREDEAWELEIQGYSQREIAARLHITQPAVCKLLHRVATRHADQRAARVARADALEDARLSYLLRQTLEAWTRSQQGTTRRHQRWVEGRGRATPHIVKDLTETSSAGNPAFLRAATAVVIAKRERLQRRRAVSVLKT